MGNFEFISKRKHLNEKTPPFLTVASHTMDDYLCAREGYTVAGNVVITIPNTDKINCATNIRNGTEAAVFDKTTKRWISRILKTNLEDLPCIMYQVIRKGIKITPRLKSSPSNGNLNIAWTRSRYQSIILGSAISWQLRPIHFTLCISIFVPFQDRNTVIHNYFCSIVIHIFNRI